MKRKVFIAPGGMPKQQAIALGLAANCAEIAHGLPRSFIHEIKESDLPIVFEEEIVPDGGLGAEARLALVEQAIANIAARVAMLEPGGRRP